MLLSKKCFQLSKDDTATHIKMAIALHTTGLTGLGVVM